MNTDNGLTHIFINSELCYRNFHLRKENKKEGWIVILSVTVKCKTVF